MLKPALRFTLMTLLAIAAMFFFSVGFPIPAGLMLAAAVILFAGYFWMGTVVLAFQHFRNGNLKKAEEVLAYTKFPDQLLSTFKGIYNYMSGVIYFADNHPDTAIPFLEKALDQGVKTLNNEAIVLMYLARCNHAIGKQEEARKWIEAALEIHSAEMVKKEIQYWRNEILKNPSGNP